MNEITINNVPMSIKEYKNQRVVTFRDIDAVHERPDGTARKRFNDNKMHFIEGEDYFVRKTDEVKAEYGIAAPNGLVLITESGYLMLVKSFTDDLAWTVQRQLVNSYFKAKTGNSERISESHLMNAKTNAAKVLADLAKLSGITGVQRAAIIGEATKIITGHDIVEDNKPEPIEIPQEVLARHEAIKQEVMSELEKAKSKRHMRHDCYVLMVKDYLKTVKLKTCVHEIVDMVFRFTDAPRESLLLEVEAIMNNEVTGWHKVERSEAYQTLYPITWYMRDC